MGNVPSHSVVKQRAAQNAAARTLSLAGGLKFGMTLTVHSSDFSLGLMNHSYLAPNEMRCKDARAMHRKHDYSAIIDVFSQDKISLCGLLQMNG